MTDEAIPRQPAPADYQSEAHRLSKLAKKRAAETEELRKQLERANAQLDQLSKKWQSHSHRTEFGKAALAAGADPDMMEDLYLLSGITPLSEEPDPKVIAAAVDALKERRPRFFPAAKTAEPAPTPTPIPTPIPTPGPPSAKGAVSAPAPAGTGIDGGRRAAILAARGTPDILRFPPAEIAEAYKSL